MKKIFATCLILGGFISASGQEQSIVEKQQMIDQVSQESIMGSVQTYDNRYEGVKGTPFLYEDWQMGSFVLTDGSTHEKILLRYDLLSDELHFQNRMKVASVIPQERLRKFTLGGEDAEGALHFTKAKYLDALQGEVKPGKLVQLLYDQGFQLVAVRFKVVKKADYQGGYSRNKAYDEITDVAPKYYLIKPGYSAQKIKPKKKAFTKAFPEKREALETLLDSNQFDLTDPNEVVMLLKQLD